MLGKYDYKKALDIPENHVGLYFKIAVCCGRTQIDGTRDVLGMRVGDNESAKFMLGALAKRTKFALQTGITIAD